MSFQQEQSSSSTSRTSVPEGGACRKAPTQEVDSGFLTLFIGSWNLEPPDSGSAGLLLMARVEQRGSAGGAAAAAASRPALIHMAFLKSLFWGIEPQPEVPTSWWLRGKSGNNPGSKLLPDVASPADGRLLRKEVKKLTFRLIFLLPLSANVPLAVFHFLHSS